MDKQNTNNFIKYWENDLVPIGNNFEDFSIYNNRKRIIFLGLQKRNDWEAARMISDVTTDSANKANQIIQRLMKGDK